MGEDVKDRRAERRHTDGQEHITELADGGIGQNFFYIVLGERDGGGEKRGGRADPGDEGQG